MPEMKNICGKIPVDLHEKVRQEIEETESSTQKFIQQVIEEHFIKKGESSMAARTIAVQVTEELFGRLKKVILRKGCKQKDFLLETIEQAIAAEEARWEAEGTEVVRIEPVQPEDNEADANEPDETQESGIEEMMEPGEALEGELGIQNDGETEPDTEDSEEEESEEEQEDMNEEEEEIEE